MSIERPVVRVMPLATIKQPRMLPVPGRVVVNQGQAVSATATVAEAHLEPHYRLVNVAQALKVPRARADEYITCRAGEVVHQGDVLAEKKGVVRQVVHSPVDGEVVVAGEGQVLLREYRQPWELPAGLPGKVIQVFAERGVVLSTKGTVIDGAWGNGKIAYGLVHPITETAAQPITTDLLSVELRGLVLVGGVLEDARVLKLAQELPARALIVGSMRASLIPEALQAPFAIVVTDGFGSGGMNARAFRLLSTSAERQAAVLAETPSPYEGQRPVIAVPLTSADFPPEPPAAAPLEEGTTVRVVRAPYLGAVGTVVALPNGVVRFANGVRAPAVDVRLESGERVTVPVANVEVLIQS